MRPGSVARSPVSDSRVSTGGSGPRRAAQSRARMAGLGGGFLLLYIFGFKLGLLPLSGGPGLEELILPAITLGLFGVPYYASVVAESISSSSFTPSGTQKNTGPSPGQYRQ